MKKFARNLRFLALGAAVFLLGACEVREVDEGEAPEVQVEEGALPEAEIETPDVDVKSDTDTVVVETPSVEVE